jgi:tripartite-type tricarboxylate transporter receptor subunit TctC
MHPKHTQTRRNLLISATGLALGTALPLPAMAQNTNWPAHPIKLVVPFSAGAFTDIASRVVAEFLSQDLGESVVVDNRAGAAGIIGTQAVISSPADGYTLLVGTISTLSMNPGLYKKLPYDVEKDLVPVSGITRGELVLVANPALKARSVPELIALAKASPGKLTYGSGGSGTTSHLYAEWFSSLAGVQLLHVPFRSQAQAIQGLLGNQIDLLFDTIPTARPHLQGNKLHALGVGSLKRSAELPDVPLIADTLPGFNVDTWAVLYARRGTPPAVLDKLTAAMQRVLAKPAVKEKLAQIGMEPLLPTGKAADVDVFVKSQTQRWTQVIQKANITVEQ